MKREWRLLLLIGAAFLLIALVVLTWRGSSYTIRVNTGSRTAETDQYRVDVQQEGEIVRLIDKRLENGQLLLRVRSVSRGKAHIEVSDPEGPMWMDSVYVHHLGIITVNGYLGRSSGAWIIPVLVTLYLICLLLLVIGRYRLGMRENLYQYRNIRNLGWIIFLASMLVGQTPYLLSTDSLVGTVERTMDSLSALSLLVFPVAFVLAILVTISNVQLMRREGRNWRNMLGILLGLLVCLGTLFPHMLSDYLQRSTIIDVHRESGIAHHVDMAVTNTMLVAVSYLECILWATVILAVKAAKRVPDPDRDYMLILGCQINGDGTLTPLLKGRADRALEFARMQKETTGKDVILVPSGGQGADEVMPEGRAIRNYLVSQGVPEEQILVEDGSANTEENFRLSMELIRRAGGETRPKIGFSTTNYHVFRSGILAAQQGVLAQGIGSRTRSYFWVNAFVREFIATVYSEAGTHLRVMAVLILLTLAMVGVVYLSNVM